MNDAVITFMANLKHAIRNHQSVEVGSGIFTPEELAEVLSALELARAVAEQEDNHAT